MSESSVLLSPSNSDLVFDTIDAWNDDELQLAAEALFKHGVIHLAACHLDEATTTKLRAAMDRIVEDITSHLNALGVEYRQQQEPFSYKEAASRCRGRIDVRHPDLQRSPFTNSSVAQQPVLKGLLDVILGEDHVQLFSGVVQSLPGAETQGWHMDGDHLFQPWQLPPHAVTVFFNLTDLAEEQGIPEFLPGSQLFEQYKQLQVGAEMTPVSFKPTAGSITVFDYRTVHRGMANLSKEPRPLLYMVFAKPWFKDAANFGDVSLIDASSAQTVNGN
eukprot:TRINITY_DN10355_c0_g2_i1.p2 TRINITY_DN10355_c0_g2~~TRINITY_DN10355_c0_g2_i1.p2  ORF type:complete len:275 (+),score=47.35 TRINITY_DN10355_c0_g2_i1:3501-4325(+)